MQMLEKTSLRGTPRKTSACSDSVWLQSYFYRAAEQGGMRARDPKEKLAVFTCAIALSSRARWRQTVTSREIKG